MFIVQDWSTLASLPGSRTTSLRGQREDGDAEAETMSLGNEDVQACQAASVEIIHFYVRYTVAPQIVLKRSQ